MASVVDWAKEEGSKQLDKLQASVQAQVGEFLGFKARILKYTSSPETAIQTKANALLTRQNILEGDLQTNLQRIDVLKTLPTSELLTSALPDIYRIYGFADDIKKQKTDVENLERSAKGQAPMTADMGISWKLGLAVLGIGGVYMALKGRK